MLIVSRVAFVLKALVCLLALIAPAVMAQTFTTFGIQYPVWIERADSRIAVGPGVSVMAGDLLRTGSGGKAWVTMADGALVKLGEQASLRSNGAKVVAAERAASASVAPGARTRSDVGVIEASFDVLEGAFRYTTQQLGQVWQRDVQIGLGGTATIGIRGTDLWGKVDGSEQFVVLLEGLIAVTPASGGERVELDAPLEIYTASNQSVATVDLSAVQALAPETELDFGAGVQVDDGAYRVNLASYEKESAAKADQARLGNGGLSASIEPVTVNGESWSRLRVTGLKTYADAQALATRAAAQFGFSSPWVSRR